MSPFPDELLRVQDALAGRYSLERELGRGGMGVVYLAREVDLDRLVALKVLPHDATAEDQGRFLHEARTAAGLAHPNIVPIHRVEATAGIAYFAMTYVEGETLGGRLRRGGPLSAEAVARTMRDVAWALAYAHERGVVHRDVKPDNVLLDAVTGRALVADFGIACAPGSGGRGPRTLVERAGTPRYMSPEQAAGDVVDGRSDLYSLGVVAHVAVTGQFPDGEPTRFLRTPLGTVIARCLQEDPAQRPPTAHVLVADLDAVLASATAAELPPVLERWATARNPLTPFFSVWSGIFGLGAAFVGGPERLPFTLLAAAPALPLAVARIVETRRALRAGYAVEDLRYAIDWLTQRRRRRAAAAALADGGETLVARAVRWLTLTSCAGVVSWIALFDGPFTSVAKAAVLTLLGAAGMGLTLSAAFSVPLVPPSIRRRAAGGLRALFWRLPAAAAITRLLRRPEDALAPALRVRYPTEVALQRASEDLFAALPTAYRTALAELPSVVEQLRARATLLRESIRALDASDAAAGAGGPSGGAPPPPTARLGSTARQQLERTVAALEALRVGLARLLAGDQTIDGLTTLLDDAGRIDGEIARLATARRDVEELLLRGSTTPTPVWTPTPS